MYFGGILFFFVFKLSSQMSEFKCTSLREDSGKPLKTFNNWGDEHV